MTEPGDLELVERWRGGDRSALDALVRRYDTILVDYLRYKTSPNDFKDVKQQVWEALTRRPPKAIRQTFRAYLFGTANHLLSRYYSRRRRDLAWDARAISLSELDTTLSQRIARKLGAQHLLVALQRIPIKDQLLLEMLYYYELSVAEVAAIENVPEGTVKSRAASARQKLRAVWPEGRFV